MPILFTLHIGPKVTNQFGRFYIQSVTGFVQNTQEIILIGPVNVSCLKGSCKGNWLFVFLVSDLSISRAYTLAHFISYISIISIRVACSKARTKGYDLRFTLVTEGGSEAHENGSAAKIQSLCTHNRDTISSTFSFHD